MTKKLLFPLACSMVLMLTACFDNTGYSYSTTFSRVVTIDTTGAAYSTPTVSFKADCTGEVFNKISNLTYPEQLGQFKLANARRAEVYIKVDVDNSYNQTVTLIDAREIAIKPVTNKELTDSVTPILAWQQKPLGGNYAPTVWVSEGYLNVVPVIESSQAGKYYLTADGVAGDTLFLNLSATYNKEEKKELIDELQCFDLRTLADSTNADAEMRAKMNSAWEAIQQHDSLRIVLSSDFHIKYYEKDTIMNLKALTNYFRCNF